MFNRENEKLIVVVLNYNFDTAQAFVENSIVKKVFYDNKFDAKPLQVSIAGPVPAEVLQQISLLAPIRAESSENDFVITFLPQEKKLVIEKNLFNYETDFETLKNILGEDGFVGAKISDISAVGINFSADFNLGQIKLNLLDKDVINIDVFKRNLTFEFVLPVQEINHISTYKIRKISGGDDTGEDRYYEVAVNCHFEFADLSLKDRINRLTELFDGSCYRSFINTADSFLRLNDAPKEE